MASTRPAKATVPATPCSPSLELTSSESAVPRTIIGPLTSPRAGTAGNDRAIVVSASGANARSRS